MELSEEAKELRRAKKREWYAKNKERVREYQRQYWEKKCGKEVVEVVAMVGENQTFVKAIQQFMGSVEQSFAMARQLQEKVKELEALEEDRKTLFPPNMEKELKRMNKHIESFQRQVRSLSKTTDPH